MPYIDAEARAALKERPPATAGELNYCLTRLVDDYLARNGLSYAALNEAVGALECAKLELYRRLAAPYEDRKRRDNGEVYRAGRQEEHRGAAPEAG